MHYSLLRQLRDIYPEFCRDSGEGDKGTAHSYLPIYDWIFAGRRLTVSRMLELGSGPHRLSSQMFVQYFHNAIIHTVDIVSTEGPEHERIEVHHLDSCDEAAMRGAGLLNHLYDLVIDDASHGFDDQVKRFAMLWPRVAHEGLYIIEDVGRCDANRDAIRRMCDGSHRGVVLDLRLNGRRAADDVMMIFEKG